MIATLEGIIELKNQNSIVLNVNGVGYEINISSNTFNRLSSEKIPVKFFVVEVPGSIYSGTTQLYGFLTKEEKEIFVAFKDNLKNIGSKKALDFLDKAMKSLPDFKKAIINKNIKLLISIFGFRENTAEKIIIALQDKIDSIEISGEEKLDLEKITLQTETIQALVALGYKEYQSKQAVEEVIKKTKDIFTTEELIRSALKYLSLNK